MRMAAPKPQRKRASTSTRRPVSTKEITRALFQRDARTPLILNAPLHQAGSSLEQTLREWRGGAREGFLFITPHDDDAVLGAALMIQEAQRAGAAVSVVVVTDGRYGYTDLKTRRSITKIRRNETHAAYEALGVPPSHIHWLNFPDAGLSDFVGRKPHRGIGPKTSPGMTGLEDAFVRLLRTPMFRDGPPPTRVFVPVAADYHPDHVTVGHEIPISIFHAAGGIWPELGPTLVRPPTLYTYPVYCPFPKSEPATLLLRASAQDFRRKITAIRAFRSQKQIAAIIREVAGRGPLEVFREVQFQLFSIEDCLSEFTTRRYTTNR